MKTVVIVSQDIVTTNIADRTISPLHRTVIFRNVPSAIDFIYNSIPHLLIIDISSNDTLIASHINNLKDDPMFSQLPVLAVLQEPSQVTDVEKLFIEDFIWKKDLDRELLTRCNMAILRSERNVEINPLTRLPGNISINRQIEERLAKKVAFAFAYADLDHFKPLNDKYGFSRGDEVIKITGRLILNIVKSIQPQNSFIGHIGGDDFVYIMDIELVEEASRKIISAFDGIILTFYDQDDKDRGHIEAVDRQGILRTFPILGISIGITDTGIKSYSHYGALTEAASEMKKFAKQTKGSSYSLDKRHKKPEISE
jgi:diguanylate cyclase (GGDEF)-like protein